MDHAKRGLAAFNKSDFLLAINEYSLALIQHPHSPDYFTSRSKAYSRLKNPPGPDYHAALWDAEFAVKLAIKRAKREQISAAQFRRGVALFGLDRWADAGFCFDIVKEMGGENKNEVTIWETKVKNKLKTLEDGDPRATPTVTKVPEVEVGTESQVRIMLREQMGHNKAKWPENELTAPQKEQAVANGAATGNKTEVISQGRNGDAESMPGSEIKVEKETEVDITPVPTPSIVPSKIRHEWYQTADTVAVTLYVKGIPSGKTEVDLHEHSVCTIFLFSYATPTNTILQLSITFPLSTGSDFSFTLDPLFAPIDPTASSFSILSTKIEVILRKQVSSQKWSSLEGTATASTVSATGKDPNGNSPSETTNISRPSKPQSTASSATKPTESVPSYPTSSKTGPKNWDKLATDLTAKKPKTKSKSKQNPVSGENPSTDPTEANDDEEDDGYDSDYASGDPVDSFFKKLYANSDPDTQRAMVKSYYESEGTALSTNWKEVAKGKVEARPPSSD